MSIITNNKSNTLVTGTDQADSIRNSIFLTSSGQTYGYGDNVTILGQAGNDTIINDGKNSLLDGGAGNDTIYNRGSYSTVNGNSGSDTIYNSSKDVTIDGGTGYDKISNAGSRSLILGGADRDSIFNGGSSVTVDGGDGNDYIDNNPTVGTSNVYNVSISGGAGNDSIFNGGTQYYTMKNVTISGGAGDDLVSLGAYAYNTTYEYAAGDGNDTLYGVFSTLQIGDGTGTYSTVVSGNDVIFSVGDGSITFKNVGKMTSLSDGTTKLMLPVVKGINPNLPIKLTEGADLYSKSLDGVTISALGGNDTIENYGSQVSIDAGAGNDSIGNGGSQVTILAGAGDDVIDLDSASSALIKYSSGDGSDTIYGFNASTSISVGGSYSVSESVNDIFITVGDGQIILRDAAENFNSLSINGKAVSLGSKLVKLNAYYPSVKSVRDSLTVVGDDADNTIISSGHYASLVGNAGNDFISNGGSNVIFRYNAGDGFDTIVGFNDSSTLQIDDTYSAELAGNDVVVTSGDGKITLQGAGTLSEIHINDRNILKPEWTLNGTTAVYSALNEPAVTVSGIKSVDGLSLEDNVIIVSASALGENDVKVSDGYTLALGSDVDAPALVAASCKDGIFTTAGKTAGYILDGNSITYSAATTKTFEFSGLDDDTSVKNFYVSGSTITVGKAAVKTDGTPVKLLTDGYSLKLGKNMAAPKNSKATYSNGIYKSAGKTAGYTLSDDAQSITYSAATTKTFEFSGLDDDTTVKNFYLSGDVITVGKAAVKTDGTPVKLLTDGYSLKLGKNMAAPKNSKATYSDGI